MTEPIASAPPTPPSGGDEAAELTDRLQRALAEVENTRKAADRDTAALRLSERLAVSAAWLPVLDHIDLALRHADADPQSIVAGVRQVREQAVRVLSQLGFEPIDAPGVPFDPRRHEAAEVVRDTGAEPGTVVRVLRPGFAAGDRLLRPATVVVSALPELPGDAATGAGDARGDGGADGV
ncbi:nucleotide exchange factor GrpE [Dactylosporangium sp. CA-052675]|uniref:nucleotide exchange factor GrpE n=1 Tax=Dactylosporangium sp. CA-052675 TaxID=3239927 RepID=UPI003D94F701